MFGVSLMRRGAFERVGPLNEAMKCSEDLEWFLRAREAGLRLTRIPDVLLYYRQHSESLTANETPADLGMVTALRGSLARRRGIAAGRSATHLPPLVALPPTRAIDAPSASA